MKWNTEPVFVLTSDTDWASEYAVDRLVDFTTDAGIKPTVFVTHESARLNAAAAKGEVELGIHPNFLPGSSHGADVDAVIAHVFKLAPDTKLWRSHAFVDGTHVAVKLHQAGIRIDSNVCLYMQQGLMPLEHWIGIRRFPVFWEDDVHWHRGGNWDFVRYRDAFFAPGLKVVNVHPFIYALNIPDEATYTAVKGNIPRLDAESAGKLRFAGPGPADFLAALADAVKAQGLRWHTLTELAALG
ncbi:polysaccharide deacetylase WbmS family protein [Dongia sp. agr-C8]